MRDLAPLGMLFDATVETWQWDIEWGLPVVLVVIVLAIAWASVAGRRRPPSRRRRW